MTDATGAPTQLSGTRSAAEPLAIADQRRTAVLLFALSMFVVVTFSQGWLMFVAGPDGDPEASTLIRFLYLPAYLAAVVLAVSVPWRTASAVILNPLLVALVGWVFASWFWSVSPDLTLRRGVALGFTTLAGVAIGAR